MRGADERPVFVIGNPRSGTTLLRLMLTSHPDVCIPQEAGFALWLYPDFAGWTPADGVDGFLTELLDTRKFHHWGLTRPAVEAFLGEAKPEDYGGLVAAVYRCYMSAVSPNAVIWGDKNNFHVTEVPAIRRLFPRSRFVHIVRDGRNVAASYRELGGRDFTSVYAPDLPQDVAAIAAEWSSNVAGVERAFEDVEEGDTLTIRLEDLQDTPEPVLSEVCALLGIAFSEAMLHFATLAGSPAGEPGEFAEWKAKNRLPVQASDAERYRRELTLEEIATFEAVAGETLRHHGYPVSE